MPLKPKTQPSAFRIALAAKRGKIPQEDLRGAAKYLFNAMSEEELSAYSKKRESERPPRMGIKSAKKFTRD